MHSHQTMAAIFNVTNITSKVHVMGWAGETTAGFLQRRMSVLPNADIIILDIGVNDLLKLDMKATDIVHNIGIIVQRLVEEKNAKKIFVSKLFHLEKTRRRNAPGPMLVKRNQRIKDINKVLETEYEQWPRAILHFHSEMDSLPSDRWTEDGLHAAGDGMVKYMQGMRRAIVNGYELLKGQR